MIDAVFLHRFDAFSGLMTVIPAAMSALLRVAFNSKVASTCPAGLAQWPFRRTAGTPPPFLVA
ncbi:hypothetical protein NP284_06950 [Rhodopseudomonas pseudopalustris]|uniref:hypothetical protein n=1 Tax=Rhodopseudomonas pseudopalustris TaxID=1513892 RepID=UPI003F9B32B5